MNSTAVIEHGSPGITAELVTTRLRLFSCKSVFMIDVYVDTSCSNSGDLMGEDTPIIDAVRREMRLYGPSLPGHALTGTCFLQTVMSAFVGAKNRTLGILEDGYTRHAK